MSFNFVFRFWEIIQTVVRVKQGGEEKNAINAFPIGTVRIKMSRTPVMWTAWPVIYPISAGVRKEAILKRMKITIFAILFLSTVPKQLIQMSSHCQPQSNNTTGNGLKMPSASNNLNIYYSIYLCHYQVHGIFLYINLSKSLLFLS